MSSRILKVLVLAIWAVGLGWLIRFEAFPERFEGTIDGYRGLFGDEMGVREQWMMIFFGGIPVGYTQTILDVDDSTPETSYLLTSTTSIRLPSLANGKSSRFRIAGEVRFDGNYLVREFGITAAGEGFRFLAHGKALEKGVFDVEYGPHDAQRKTIVRIPSDVIIQSPQLDLVLKRLRPGQHLWLKVFDPLSMRPERVRLAAKDYEILQLRDGRKVRALRIEITHSSGPILAWVDSRGLTLRQETPFGLVLETCTPGDALGLDDNPSAPNLQQILKDGLFRSLLP